METLRMSRKERLRLEVLGRVRRKELGLSKAAELLEVSYRQVKRIWKRYQESRARKEHMGELVQMDGSHHDWFEGRREQAVLR